MISGILLGFSVLISPIGLERSLAELVYECLVFSVSWGVVWFSSSTCSALAFLMIRRMSESMFSQVIL